MVQAPHRASLRGPTFVRLLARLTDAEVARSRQTLSDRLSHWLDWTHAVALSTALDGRAAAPAADTPTFGDAEADECTRLRHALVHAIGSAPELAPGSEASAADAPDYAPFRQRYLTLQRSMQSATGQLRGRLRDRLAARAGDMGRLAEVDAVMERALSPREQTLLASVPHLLGEHFERLRAAAQTTAESSDVQPVPADGAWLDVFRKDMQGVLYAELDVRFQPVEALLAALRAR